MPHVAAVVVAVGVDLVAMVVALVAVGVDTEDMLERWWLRTRSWKWLFLLERGRGGGRRSVKGDERGRDSGSGTCSGLAVVVVLVVVVAAA
eukprot:973167-Pyramimonas_sp.AAC.1